MITETKPSHTCDAPVVCTCDYHAPRQWELTSPSFLAALAKHLTAPGLSAPQIVYGAFDELLNKHSGTLYGLGGKAIDLNAIFADGEDILEWAFGSDWGRGMRRLLERAERPFRNQMKASPKLLTRILLLHYALEIHRCRTSGRCTSNAASPT